MESRDISQAQVLQLLEPLFEYLNIDAQDVSRVHFTSGWLGIERFGKISTKIYYTDGGFN